MSDGQHNDGPISESLLFSDDFERSGGEYILTTFGYGDDHDARLMQSMSEKRGGSYYYIDEISDVEDCFSDSIALMTSRLGRNIRARVKLSPSCLFPDIMFKKMYGPYWRSKSLIESSVNLSSFYAGLDKNFLCLLHLNAVVTKERLRYPTEVEIGSLEVKIDSLTTPIETKTFTKAIKLWLLPHKYWGEITKNSLVEQQISRVKAVETIGMAQKLNEMGEHDQAINLLNTFSIHLEDKSYRKKELFVKIKESIAQQKKLIKSNKNGNFEWKFKINNFSIQARNIFMNEQSAPRWCKGLYQNKKMKAYQHVKGLE